MNNWLRLSLVITIVQKKHGIFQRYIRSSKRYCGIKIILSPVNKKVVNFLIFVSQALDVEESTAFFKILLPKIVDLALSLPQLITNGIPLLRKGLKHSISLSQVQISCLLANAFLCTFPHRGWKEKNSDHFTYPDINFNRWKEYLDARFLLYCFIIWLTNKDYNVECSIARIIDVKNASGRNWNV